MKFGHIGIKVTDMALSLKFYTEVLECKILKDYQYPDSHLVFLDAHGTVIELIGKPENEERSVGPVEHIAFKVDNLEEKIEALKAYGIHDISEPKIVGKGKIVFFNGPNNERFEFVAKITEV
ncbi:MAG: VOC family protein [Clostridia bacterium]|nr:VOC family protein [Clostridia bacterium]